MASATVLEDRTLHQRLMAHDGPALAELYDQFSPTVFGVALRVTSDRSAAEDVTQLVFLDMWRQPERFDPERGSLRPWLATVAHHRSIDWLRQQQATRLRDEANTEMVAPPDIEEAVEAVLIAERVRAALSKLPEHERTPIRLAYFSSRTYREVAGDLEVPEGTVKSRIRSGLRHMAISLHAEAPEFPERS
jgi:RNA polymerase sigma-70 factor (ECF subfamily)